MQSRELEVEILDFWLAGSGRGEGSFLDAVPALDHEGLPYLPGRTLKGLLRDAADCLEEIGGCERGTAAYLFGSRQAQQDRYATVAGALRVGSARLPADVRSLLREKRALREALFHVAFQTAIDPKTGAAAGKTLRSSRMVVPLTLRATLHAIGEVGDEHWRAVDASLCWLTGVGSGRSRGFGRCVTSLSRAEHG